MIFKGIEALQSLPIFSAKNQECSERARLWIRQFNFINIAFATIAFIWLITGIIKEVFPLTITAVFYLIVSASAYFLCAMKLPMLARYIWFTGAVIAISMAHLLIGENVRMSNLLFGIAFGSFAVFDYRYENRRAFATAIITAVAWTLVEYLSHSATLLSFIPRVEFSAENIEILSEMVGPSVFFCGLISFALLLTSANRIEKTGEINKNLSENYKHALDSSALVSITDINGKIIYCNDEFSETSKYTHEELLGQQHNIINSGLHDKFFWNQLWKTISTGKIWKGEVRNRAKDGSFYWVNSTIVPFLDQNGKPFQYVALRFDITERKKNEEKMAEQTQELIQTAKLAEVGEIFSGIGHEISNPLGVILGAVESSKRKLEKGTLDPKNLEKCMTRVTESVHQIDKIVTSMMNFVRKDVFAEPEFENIDVSNLFVSIEELITIRRKRYPNTRFDLVKPKSHILLNGNPTQLAQVLVNLVNNAFDATAELKMPWVRLECWERDENVFFSVTDAGNGIPPEARKKIFTPFFTTKDRGKGTGMGLSIVKRIVEASAGALKIDENSPNTRFIVKFPKEKPAIKRAS